MRCENVSARGVLPLLVKAAMSAYFAALLIVGAATAGEPSVKGSAEIAVGCVAIKVGAAGTRRCVPPASGATTWFRDCETCPEMIVAPKGAFRMGSSTDERGHAPHEMLRQVRITRPFAIGRFAVTFDEWDACVADGGCNGYRPADEGWGRGNRPVVNVNWADADAYVRWLSRKIGKRYRLPDEAEREYAARAGTTTAWWWGTSIETAQANFDVPVSAKRGVGAVGLPSRTRQQTVPVDAFAPNPWGLFNVHGNVWEWTADCWREVGPVGAKSGQATRAGSCGERVAKGGSWNDVATETRSASRIGFGATTRNAMQGFRVVRTLP